MKKALVRATILGVGFLLVSGTVFAQSTSCDFGTLLPPDGRDRLATLPGSTTHHWAFYASNNRSYSIEVAPDLEDYNGLNATYVIPDANTLCATNTTLPLTDTKTTEPILDANGNSGTGLRNSLRVPAIVGNGYMEVNIVNGGATAQGYRIRLVDTTIFSPAFSTNGAFDTFYSLYNNTNATISGTLVLTRANGTSAGSTNLTILAGQTAATNTIALGTVRNISGTALFYHDGTPGGITAEAAIASFSLSPPYIQVVKFAPRDNLR